MLLNQVKQHGDSNIADMSSKSCHLFQILLTVQILI